MQGEKGRLRTVYTCLAELRAGRLGDSDVIPDTAGGEGSHRAAIPHLVIHKAQVIICAGRYLFARFASVTQLLQNASRELPSFAGPRWLRLPLSTLFLGHFPSVSEVTICVRLCIDCISPL